MAKIGRPRMNPDSVKRAPLNMRTTPELRQKIEEAAAKSGYSMTQEVERRLLASFDQDQFRQIIREELARADGRRASLAPNGNATDAG